MSTKNYRLNLDKELLYKLYIEDRMTSNEVANYFGCSSKCVRNYLKFYNIPIRQNSEAVKLERSKRSIDKKRARSRKFINTWSSKSKEEKQTINKKKANSNTLESIHKARNTKFNNKTYIKSKSENMFYNKLLLYFDESDIERNYCLDERYPYSCDFYIKSRDLFIEYQGHWTHGYEPYNENNACHQEYLQLMKSKGIDMKTWTVRDVNKLNTAIRNNIKLILIYPRNNSYVLLNRKLTIIDINDISEI